VTAKTLNSHGDEVGYLLKKLSAAFRRQLDERLRHRKLDVSMSHMATLFAVQDEPGLAGAQLARRLMFSPQAMNNALRLLESEGLITRQRHPENRRIDCWSVTGAGEKRLRRARKVAAPVLETLTNALSMAERRELKRLLGLCIAALEPR
jgi:DNA-binding MarR family transcriptional regulator